MDEKKIEKMLAQFIKYWRPLLYAMLVIVIITFLISASFLVKSKATGNSIGNAFGVAVGKASGSYDGWNEGYDKGKEEGLSAKDTTVTVKDALSEVATLRVLSAKVLINNFHEVGETDKGRIVSSITDDKKYSAIYSYNGQVDFFVDLSHPVITGGNGEIIIELPLPHAELIIDEKSAVKVADKQKIIWNGSDDDGIDAYNNSVAEIKKRAVTELENYNTFLEMAKSSAQRQIADLVKAVNLNHDNPIVRFRDEGGNNGQ